MSDRAWAERWPRRFRAPTSLIGLGLLLAPIPAVAQVVQSATAESQAMARAASAERAGRIEEARRELEGVLDANPGSSSSLAMLAQLLTPRGRAIEVLPRAEEAVEALGTGDVVAMTVWVRTLAAAGHPDSAVAVAERWAREGAARPAAYREWASVVASVGRPGEAIDILLAGRDATGNEGDFAQDLAVLYAAEGEYRRASTEWLKLLSWGEPGVSAVAERLEADGIDTGAAVAELREAAAGKGLPLEARRGALLLAFRIQRPDWARELAEQIVSAAPMETRRLVLREYFVEATNRGRSEDAAWAAGELERSAEDEAERRHWRAMQADAAFRLGDADEAEKTFSSLARSAEPGTETHRRSLRRLFSIRTAEGAPEAELLLAQYASAYSDDGSEMLDMMLELSDARISAGDLRGAAAALDLLPPPVDPSLASRLEGQRGVLALLDGRPSIALSHLETAAFIPGGDPLRRTDALLLVSALDRADSASAAALGRGMLELRVREDPASILAAVETWAADDGLAEAPALLALAAGALKSGGFEDEKRQVLERLVATRPGSDEAPAALLELGRDAESWNPEGARAWYERLIVEYPDHALAPIARQELSMLASEPEGR